MAYLTMICKTGFYRFFPIKSFYYDAVFPKLSPVNNSEQKWSVSKALSNTKLLSGKTFSVKK